MDDSKFLIVGANGQLGTALRQKYPRARAVDVAELDITNVDSVQSYDWSNIELILNAAAYTDVDGAETDEGRVAAWKVNAQGVANLAEVALTHDLMLVHISTEYVFDGREAIHTETEPMSPLSAYGASKAAGDIAAAHVAKHYILRTSWVVGKGKNIVRTMLEVGQKIEKPKVISDQIGRPTFTQELVRAIDHFLKTKPTYGTYNISNGGDGVSLADLARAIFAEANLKVEVEDTTDSEFFADKPEAAKRPLKRLFDLSKLEATGFKPTDWREDLREYIKKELRK